jgi:hypothetical protein
MCELESTFANFIQPIPAHMSAETGHVFGWVRSFVKYTFNLLFIYCWVFYGRVRGCMKQTIEIH